MLILVKPFGRCLFASSDFPAENPRPQTRNVPYTRPLPARLKKFVNEMKILNKIFLIAFFIANSSCVNLRYQPLEQNDNASLEIKNKIKHIEEQFKRAEQGKSHNYSELEKIANISGIGIENFYSSWCGIGYGRLTTEELSQIKNWFEQNDGNFYFNDKHRILEFYEFYGVSLNKSDFILVKNKDNTISSTFGYGEYFTAYSMLYQHRNLTKSKSPSDRVLCAIMDYSLNEKKGKNGQNLENLHRLSKIDTVGNQLLSYDFINWFSENENFIYYEVVNDEKKIAIKYPNEPKIILNENFEQ